MCSLFERGIDICHRPAAVISDGVEGDRQRGSPRTKRRVNNRAESSHKPFRGREADNGQVQGCRTLQETVRSPGGTERNAALRGEVTEWNPIFAYAALELGFTAEVCWPRAGRPAEIPLHWHCYHPDRTVSVSVRSSRAALGG